MTFSCKHGIDPRLEGHPTFHLWECLVLEGEHELVNKLRQVETGIEGFRTIIVPPGGFCQNEVLNQIVTDWLKERNVNIVNVEVEILELQHALRSTRCSLNLD